MASLAIVFVLALSARLIYFLIFIYTQHDICIGDPFCGSELGQVASNLYYGRGFSSPFESGNLPTAYFAPLVPVLWSAIFHLVGDTSKLSYVVIVLLQIIASSLSVCVYWLCARQVESKSPLRFQGFTHWAGVMFILWPESILRNIDPWYFVWQELGLAVLVYLGMLWIDSPRRHLGVLLGLAAGIIGNINPTPFPVYLAILAVPLLQRSYRTRQVLGGIALSLVVAVICLAPWTIRNYRAFDQVILGRSNFGLQLWLGNNPTGAIRMDKNALHPYIDKQELKRYNQMGEVTYFQQAAHQAVEYIRQHPTITSIRFLQRAYVLWLTDITDQWSWFPNREAAKWWKASGNNLILSLTTMLSAVLPLVVVLYGLARRKLAGLPYWQIFLSIFIFMPLTYYFTLANPVYTQSVRTWLAFLAVLVLVQINRRTIPNAPKPLIKLL